MLNYSMSNESLDAIVRSLNINPKDKFACCSGSGDQALALAEYTGHIDVYELNPIQIELIIARQKQVKDGNFSEFRQQTVTGYCDGAYNGTRDSGRTLELWERRNQYFDDARLSRIRLNLPLVIHQKNVFSLDGMNNFLYDKVYLSNADWPLSMSPKHTFSTIVSHLPIDALIYVIQCGAAYGVRFEDEVPGIMVDKDLTEIARSYETLWKPKVYRKIA